MGKTTVPDTQLEEGDEVTELANWIGKTAQRLKDDDGCTIVVTHVGTQQIVDRIDLSDDVGSIEALAEKVYNVAAKDAEGVGGGTYFVTIDGADGRHPLVFELEALEEEGSGPEHHHGMMRHGGMGQGGPGGQGGFPGRMPVEGWVKFNEQTLRHNEMLFEATIRERSEVFKLFKTQITEQHETIRFMERERAKEKVLVEELMSAKHIRDIELRRIEKAEDRKDEALGLVKPWAHSISARLLGPAGVSKDVAPLLDMFEAVFSTFTPEQFQAIMGSELFTQRQKQELGGIFSTIMNLREQAAKAAQASGGSAPSSPNGQA